MLSVPEAWADVPVNQQFVQAVRAAQGQPPSPATDQQLMAEGLSMCAYVTAKSGIVDPTTGIPAFTRSQIRANQVDQQSEAGKGPIFDAAVTYLCADAWSTVHSAYAF